MSKKISHFLSRWFQNSLLGHMAISSWFLSNEKEPRYKKPDLKPLISVESPGSWINLIGFMRKKIYHFLFISFQISLFGHMTISSWFLSNHKETRCKKLYLKQLIIFRMTRKVNKSHSSYEEEAIPLSIQVIPDKHVHTYGNIFMILIKPEGTKV